jgi:hypothetical protein
VRVPLLTKDDIRRYSWFAWACLAALAGVAAWLWSLDKHSAAEGTAAALAGCLGLILPPRERMETLPWRVRALPRSLDSTPVLAALLSSPGYGLNWFYGANPYDETVHLLSGGLAGAVFVALLQADGLPRAARRLSVLGALFGLGLGSAWEVFEWATGLIGDWTDTWTDVALTALGATIASALAGLARRRRDRPGAEPGAPGPWRQAGGPSG